MNNFIISILTPKNRETFHVRPLAGAPYGAGDGSSYADAWGGFAAVDQTACSGNILEIAGTHTETFTVTQNNIWFTSRVGDPATIDSASVRSEGMVVNGRTGTVITGITMDGATVSNLDIRGTGVVCVTNDLVLTNSGNQGVQHYGTCIAIHNNITCTDNFDDGISGHDSSTVTVNGATLARNSAGINFVNSSTCTVNGTIVWGSGANVNTTYDMQSSGADSDKSTTIIYNSTSTPESECNAFSGGWIQMNGTVANPIIVTGQVTAASAGTGFLDLNGVILNGSLNVNSGGVANISNSIVTTMSATAGNINYSNCRIRGASNYSGIVTLEFCLIDGGADIMIDMQSGSNLSIKYCVFHNTGTDYGVALRTGCTVANFSNVTFSSTSGTSNGLFSNINITIKNVIFTGLAIGIRVVGTGIVVTGDYCCTFNNTIVSNGTGTYTQTNGQTTDPKLVDPANLDFSLDTGSSCIGTGDNLGASLEEGIIEAIWGNGTTIVPSTTTGNQLTNWNIGAYV